MLIDGSLPLTMGDAPGAARKLEADGYTGGFTFESSHDPFLPIALAAEHTTTLELGTAIAIAFARNPMTTANVGWDLQEYSGGRFILGLGSQIKPHVTKRFSMEWSRPAARMQEFVGALHAIWDCWRDGTKLTFDGDFYHHTLMTPMFTPAPNEMPDPKVFLAAVGPLMTTVTGRVANGWFVHPFTTESYLREVSMPALTNGLDESGRNRSDIEISLPVYVIAGDDDTEIADRSMAVKKQLAFYGSTPAYRPVLDHHGWGDAHTELNQLSKRGEWNAMADLIDDTMLDTFAIVGAYDEIAPKIVDRYGSLVDRLSFHAHFATTNPEPWAATIAALINEA